MKTILFAAVLATLGFTACQKNTIDLPNSGPVPAVITQNEVTAPENVAIWVKTNYPDYTISKTTVTRVIEEVFYNVTIKRNAPELDQKIILFDSNGDFMRIQHL
jgi:hypothetical protein